MTAHFDENSSGDEHQSNSKIQGTDRRLESKGSKTSRNGIQKKY